MRRFSCRYGGFSKPLALISRQLSMNRRRDVF
jgi:hypothetical protein